MRKRVYTLENGRRIRVYAYPSWEVELVFVIKPPHTPHLDEYYLDCGHQHLSRKEALTCATELYDRYRREPFIESYRVTRPPYVYLRNESGKGEYYERVY